MTTALRRLLPTAAAFLFSACLEGGDNLIAAHGGGGGEDFPNTVQTLGKVAAEGVSAADGWTQVQSIQLPALPDFGGLDSLRVAPALSKRSALGKAAAASPECVPVNWTWDIVEFLLYKRIRKITCDDDSMRVRRDTLVYLYNGAPLPNDREELEQHTEKYLLLVGSHGGITWKQSDKIQVFRCTNLDSSGGLDEGEYWTIQVEAGGSSAVVQRTKIYGPDGAYLDSGAPLEEYEYTRLGAAGDTLEWKRMTDLDGDRRLWPDTGAGLVELRQIVADPAGEPNTARLTSYLKAELRHDAVQGDSLRQLYYRDTRRLRNGGAVAFSFRGTGVDSLLRTGDTALVSVDTAFASADSMEACSSRFRLLLGSAPDRFTEHSMVGYRVEKTQRRGKAKHSVSVFTPAAPLPSGQAFAGSMNVFLEYFNGDRARTTGVIDAQGMTLDVLKVEAGGQATASHIVLDADGNVVSASVTPLPGFDSILSPAARRAPRP